MAYRVTWSRRSVQDLEAIANYIAADSLTYARTVVKNIVLRTKRLSQFPRSGKKVQEFDDENIRELVMYSYRIIYRTENQQVVIAAVIHGKRNLQ